ncbi:LysR family transcriptional regulator [Listeria monocytogenes]|uniref:LysR family transcriptional regulator n=1 Tax=Listeria welshimeri TaxID=1643 RepID=UPI0012F243FD|nr:LysR family transcriptional regulator [Listeria welshimeri]EAF1855880.1 LysR family transcriptional regulator [Listeria monocytogenes]EKY4027609.1 LysR family transcriptional regulator [Listeria innocua]EHR7112087.1 LysR family transcriptional regulator [Listeria monocytogenes]EIR9711971.1 LysR family transcriptional regulator [Listeria monocytogenes]ELD8333488.1 LysR family transcriptional regulator [Listeria innocua]
MSKSIFIKADEVAKELGVSYSFASKLVRNLNKDLDERGFITIAGRVSRKYYEEKLYGQIQKKGGN